MADKFILGFPISEKTASSVLFQNGGNVGIGTDSPGAKLEISSTPLTSGDARYELVITENNTASAGRGGGLAFSRQGTIFGGIKTLQNTSNNDNTTMYFQTRGSGVVSNRMVIDELGNVGIGTTNPGAKLHVYNPSGGNATTKAEMGSQAVMKLRPHATDSTNMTFAQVDNGNSIGIQVSNGPQTANYDIALNPFGGNVGIGVTDPLYKLEVQGQAGIELYNGEGGGNVLNFRPSLGDANKYNMSISSYDHSGGGTGPADGLSINGFDGVSITTASASARQERMRIASNGNVGIGTTNPLNNFVVAEATNQHGIELIPGTLSYIQAYDRTTSDYGDLQIDAQRIGFGLDNGAEKVTFLANGNVGIGETNPNGKLEVVGTATNTKAVIEAKSTYSTSSFFSAFRAKPANGNNSAGSGLWLGAITPTTSIISTGASYYSSGQYYTQNSYTIIEANSGDLKFYTGAGAAAGLNTPVERMRIASDGNVQVKSADGVTGVIEVKGGKALVTAVGEVNSELNFGSNDPSATGEIGGSIKSVTENANGAYVGMSFYTCKQGRSPALEEAMRLTHAGIFLVNQTTPNSNADGFAVYPAGSTGGTLVNCYNGSGGQALRVGVSTTIISTLFVVGNTTAGSISHPTASSTNFNQLSDYRLKEDLQDFNGLDMISDIPVYDFKWKSEESRSYGVMAHELQEVLPQAVTGEKDATEEYEVTPATLDEKGNVSAEAVMGVRDSPQGVDYSKIVPLLVKSIQELKAEIGLLKAR